jgi:CHAT domain-containing protein
MSVNNLASMLSSLGRREEALARAEEAVRTYRELARRDQAAFLPNLAGSLNNLAGMLSASGCREKALGRAEEAVAAYQELASKNPGAFLPDLAMSLINLAAMLSALGRLEEALKRAEDAVNYRRQLVGGDRAAFLPSLAAALSNLAGMLGALGRREEALERAEEAVRIFHELPEATRRALVDLRSKAYRTVGSTCLTPDRSGARDLTRALDALYQSIQCVEEHRGSFRDDAQRRRVLAEAIDSYELLVQTAVDLWDTQRDVEPLRQALHAAEGIRQRQLLERLRAEVLEPDAPDAVGQKWRCRFEELEAAESALGALALNALDKNWLSLETGRASPTADDPWSARRKAPVQLDVEAIRVKLERRREEACRQHERALKAVHDTHPGFDPYQPLSLASHWDADQLLRAIPGTVLVEYVVCQSVGYALLVWGQHLHAICLPELSARGAGALARRWMKGYPKRAGKQGRRVAALIRWGDEMEAKLLEFAPTVLWPVLRALKEFEKLHWFTAKRLVLCPHQFLNLLPIHAMPLERQGDNLLVDRYEVSYAPSLSVMKRCAGRRSGAGSRVLFGNPTDDLRFIGAATEAYRQDHPKAKVIHGRAASVEQLIKSGMGMGWGEIWAHMSASDDPMEAGIVLGDGEMLRLERIYRELRLRLKPHVTLNGCESGLLNPVRRRKTAGGTEELVVEDLADFDGLPMGFLFAGARSVVSTLWTVFDVSAALLMDRYHAELAKGGSTPASALRRASQWLRKKIRNGTELQAAGEAVLRRVPEEWARAHADDLVDCRSMLAQMAAEHPHDPPFASPIHWASHYVTGWCWDPVNFDENTRSNFEPGSNSAKSG